MGNFLKENWLWILIPVVLVGGGLLVLMYFSGSGDGDQPFTYPIW